MTGPPTLSRGRFLLWGLAFGFAGSSAVAQDSPPQGPAANVFISPAGKPFRAKEGASYPVADWFKQTDKNGDGKIDKVEFVADAEAFFKLLDRNADGVLSPLEVAVYEQRIAPEILGYRVDVSSDAAARPLHRAYVWRAQVDQPGPIDPGGSGSDLPPRSPHALDESGAGASPFGFFDEPEPLMAADFRFRGVVAKADFLKLAEIHFATLDGQNLGYLTLASLPETPMQKRLSRGRRKR